MKKLLLILLSCLTASAYGQSITCDPNMDFENGNTGHWSFYHGLFYGTGTTSLPGDINTPETVAGSNGFLALESGTATDQYGHFPIVAPDGGSYSMKVGNNVVNNNSDKAEFFVHVPAGVDDYSLIYRYAIVMEDPGHTADQQPRFNVNTYDSATGNQVPCGNFSYVAGSLPGFAVSNVGGDVYYKPWATAAINLSGYAGKTVHVLFTRTDCALGGHFGYGYIDMTCGLFKINIAKCSYNANSSLYAPPGFQTYTWYNSNYTTTVGTGDTVSFATPTVTSVYHVICTPYNGYGCPDTLTTQITVSNLALTHQSNDTLCQTTSVTLNENATGGNGALSYSWLPTTGLNCSTCSTPSATPSSTTQYTVSVTDSSGCGRVDSVLVFVKTPASAATPPGSYTVCPGTSVSFSSSATGYPAPTAQWQLSTDSGATWNNIVGQTTSPYTFNAALSQDGYQYRVVYTNQCGTSITAAGVLSLYHPPVVTSNPVNAASCSGSSVTFTAASTGTPTPTVQWQVSANSGSTWSNISGATSTSYGFTGDVTKNGYQYRAVFTNTCSSQTTTAATYNFSNPPAQPAAFTVAPVLVLQGQTNVVYTVPSVANVTYNWSYTGTGASFTGTGNSISVNFSTTATAGSISVTETSTFGCGTSTARSIAVAVNPEAIWQCNVDTNWNNPANWSCGFVPYATISVHIPATSPCKPSITGPQDARTVKVDSGTNININCPGSLNVYGDLYLNGNVNGCGPLNINGTTCATIFGKGIVNNFVLNNSCGGIINAGDTLHIRNTYTPTLGTMTVNGGLELLSDSTGTATILSNSNSCNYIVGNVTCDKWIHGHTRAFRFLSHPFSTSIGLNQLIPYLDITGQGGAANGFTPTATNNPSAFSYNTLLGNGSGVDDNTGWIPYTNTNGLGANAWNPRTGLRLFMRGSKGQGLGCAICVPNPVVLKMTGPVNECDQVVSCQTNSNYGYNFVGNPYASNIDLSTTLRGSSVGPNFAVWDPNQGTEGAYVDQPFAFSYILPAYSAFFVTNTANTNNTITFHESDKTNSAATGNLFKTTSGYGSNVVQLRILSNNDSLSWDRLLIFFNGQSYDTYDQLDGQKLNNPDLDFYTYSSDNHQLSIDVRPYEAGQVIKLGLATDTLLSYSIRVDDYNVPASAQLYLHDKYLNVVQPLQLGMHYNFSVTADSASQGDNRFELNTTGNLSVSNVNASSAINVELVPNPATDAFAINFNAPQEGNTTVRIVNAIGQDVYNVALGNMKNGKVTVPVRSFAPGIYLVTLNCGGISVTKRLVKQ
ncbi:MAG: T9SS type A sorting domain-containing protein [Flavipsychrobacter sp.]|nr:T9SS type A sorting domain-containing protein [Flavipsychrobacter sp.]